MDKLGEALVILTSKAEENNSIMCHAFTGWKVGCLIDEYTNQCFPCQKCTYANHKLLDKPIEILNRLEK